jgi:hypothetical protein
MILIAVYLLPLVLSACAVAAAYGVLAGVYMTIRILLEPAPVPSWPRAEARDRYKSALRGHW